MYGRFSIETQELKLLPNGACFLLLNSKYIKGFSSVTNIYEVEVTNLDTGKTSEMSENTRVIHKPKAIIYYDGVPSSCT